MEPFARIGLRSDNHFADRQEVEAAVGKLYRSTRSANLGAFTGYRIGLDIGNGNIGWCILFEKKERLYFLSAEDIVAHNASLPPTASRTQLPDLRNFVPLGTHKFEARESGQKGEKSFSKLRAEAKTRSRLLDARQRRKLHVRNALQKAGLLPIPFRPDTVGGHARIKADRLRVELLSNSFEAHPHDLGRALLNLLKRRGLMKPKGRRGENESSRFGTDQERRYREALARFGCETIGQFLDRCARDAERDRVPFRKRHRSLAWQEANKTKEKKSLASEKSYEVFQFLTPTFGLIWEEAELLRSRHAQRVAIDDGTWAHIKDRAGYRRDLKAKVPGFCEYLGKPHYRCIRALPSFQRFRILEQVSHLRDAAGKELKEKFAEAVLELERHEKLSLAALAKQLGIALRRDKDDADGKRSLVGPKTDLLCAEILGAAWTNLPIETRDDWTMRFLRRHWPKPEGEPDGKISPWRQADEDSLERDATNLFGSGALDKIDDEIVPRLEDKFASMSLKAAKVRAKCYEQRNSHEEMLAAMRAAGARDPVLPLYQQLPYYGAIMPDLVVPAEGFAPAERTCAEERDFGRAANPDVHIVMNRLRKVLNAIVDMMGGILPSRCIIEMARSAFSEEQANEYSKTAAARRELRERIVAEIDKIFEGLGKRRPSGPGLDKLIDRWKAAIRQGWRDYDGSEFQPSALVDGNEYQLDHVVPAAFGDYRENNMFVSRFNQQKGRRLPWGAFKDKHQPALVAFATFGLTRQIEVLEAALKRGARGERLRRLQASLGRAKDELQKLAEFAAARQDVLRALERTLTDSLDTLVSGDTDAAESEGRRDKRRPFKTGDQAALFRKFCWERKESLSEPAARDVANIGWNTKLALRYVQHLGAEAVAIKAWAPYALRSMFNIKKHRSDLRNHACDAFMVAHFDSRILMPAFNQLRARHFEDIYDPRALEAALGRVRDGNHWRRDFEANLARLETILPTIGTAHRADNQWNPGDRGGGSFGAIGKENIYSFRPDLKTRTEITAVIRGEGPAMTREEILAFAGRQPQNNKERTLREKVLKKIQLRYLNRAQVPGKATEVPYDTAFALKRRPNSFVDGTAKFAVVGHAQKKARAVVGVGEFSQMPKTEREKWFARSEPIFRSGDTAIYSDKAFVITGVHKDTRAIAYPIDEAERDKEDKQYLTTDEKLRRFASDVLGRRLHRLRKAPGGLAPVPYSLRG